MPLQPPPRSPDGKVLPHDHSGIPNLSGVIRRISIEQTWMDESGRRRISSLAYRPSSGESGGMSVDLECSIIEAGLDPKTHVTTPRWIGSVRFHTGLLRAEEFIVGFDPVKGEHENPHHGQVWGVFSRSKKRRLAELAAWFVPIDGVELI